MRAVIQRVSKATCTVEGKVTGEIQQGLLVFLGIEDLDDDLDLSWLAQKIANLRIFSDEQDLMNKSIQDVQGNILLISQFTLFAQTKKGNRPSFIRASKAEKAKHMYLEMASHLSTLLNKSVQMGVFGAQMEIDLVNQGPVTIVMNTKDKENF